MSFKRSEDERPLRPGDCVEVKPAAAILATLDRSGALDGMPFMPEMLAYAGRRFVVSRRVDKICNTIDTSGDRRMRETVYLEDLRCDGRAHGGCEAGCKLYWKDAWLQRVESNKGASAGGDDPGLPKLAHLAKAATRTVRDEGDTPSEVWRCQATDALKASVHLKVSHVGQYWRELTNGNYGPIRFAQLAIRGFVMEVAFRLGLIKPLPLSGPASRPIATERLDLKPGEVVQVRSPKEIAKTLDPAGFNRGLSFDREMLPYCGRKFRVARRVRQIIDDKTGRMMSIPKDSVILEGVVCSGERSVGRWFCPREIYAYWRESWLKRVDEEEGTSGQPVPLLSVEGHAGIEQASNALLEPPPSPESAAARPRSGVTVLL